MMDKYCLFWIRMSLELMHFGIYRSFPSELLGSRICILYVHKDITVILFLPPLAVFLSGFSVFDIHCDNMGEALCGGIC